MRLRSCMDSRKSVMVCLIRGSADQSGALRVCRVSMSCCLSEPDSNAGDDPGVVDILELSAALIRRAPVGALPHHPDIGSELTMELVAQAEPGLDRAQPTANSDLGIVLAPGLTFDQPLADQSIGEQHFVLGFRPDPDLAGLAQVRRG